MSAQAPAPGQSVVGRLAVVLYDGQCPLCLKGVSTLQRLDWFSALTYGNALDRQHLPAHEPPLDPERLLEEMHLLTPDGRHVYRGFSAFRWMAWRLPLLWPLAPFLYLPGAAAVGNYLYRWVARNRFHLVPCHGGVCTLPGQQHQHKG